MAEIVSNISFSHKEVAEALVRKLDLHSGIWGLYIEFGIGAANIGGGPDDLNPAAIVPVLKIGLQKFRELNAISVDAAKVNPQAAATARTAKPSRDKKRGQASRAS